MRMHLPEAAREWSISLLVYMMESLHLALTRVQIERDCDANDMVMGVSASFSDFVVLCVFSRRDFF